MSWKGWQLKSRPADREYISLKKKADRKDLEKQRWHCRCVLPRGGARSRQQDDDLGRWKARTYYNKRRGSGDGLTTVRNIRCGASFRTKSQRLDVNGDDVYGYVTILGALFWVPSPGQSFGWKPLIVLATTMTAWGKNLEGITSLNISLAV